MNQSMRFRCLLAFAVPVAAACTGESGSGSADGVIIAQRSHGPDGFDGVGIFQRWPLLWMPVWLESPGFPSAVDGCDLEVSSEPGFTDAQEDTAPFLDVGPEIDVVGPNGTLTMYPDEMSVYAGYGTAGLFAPGATYTVSGEGFDRDLVAPDALTLTSPALDSTAGEIVIDRQSSFDIAWTPGTGDPLRVAIVSFEDTESEEGMRRTSLVCDFADDGSAAISSADLVELPTDFVDVYIYRVNHDVVSVPGAKGTYVGIFDMWSRDGRLE